MRKLLTGACVIAAAVAVQFGASAVDASAANIAPADVTIDYANQKMTIAESAATKVKDLQVGYAAATMKVVKKKVTNEDGTKTVVSTNTLVSAKDAAWEWHDGNAGISVDLSSLNRAKDNYIQIKGDKNTDPLTIKIPAINSKVAAVFDPVTAKVTINDVTNKKEPVALTGAVEYKTQYSGWEAYTAGTTKLDSYQYKGAVLNFRLAASKNAKVSTATADTTSIPEETVYPMTGTFPGKELKVAVPKLANGPKVTANYLAVQFNIPAKTEYRFNTAAKLGTWTTAEDPSKAAKLTDIESHLVAAGSIEVRVAATDKKPASKATKLVFDQQDKLTAPKSGKSTAVATVKAADLTKNVLGSDYSVAYSSKLVKKAVTNFVDITNNTDATYQVIVANADVYPTTTLPDGSAKATATLAANKKVSVKVTEGQLVFIRKTGNAKTATWATPYVALGKVVIPAAE